MSSYPKTPFLANASEKGMTNHVSCYGNIQNSECAAAMQFRVQLFVLSNHSFFFILVLLR